MNLRERFLSFVPFIICFFLFCLSIFPHASVVCIGLLMIAWFLSPNFSEIFKNVFRDKTLMIFIVYYFIHAVSIFYSSNLSYGFFDLQVKLSFLIFPFLLPAFSFGEKEIKQYKKYFIYGTIIASLGCLINSYIKFKTSHNLSDFFYMEYSYFLHPAYFTVYLNLALLFLMEDFFINDEKSFKFNFIKAVQMFFLLVSITLLSSRTAWAVSLFTVFIYLVILFFEKRNRKKVILFTVIAAGCIVTMQLNVLNYFNRFAQLQTAIQTTHKPVENVEPTATASPVTTPQESNGISVRLQLWKNAWEVIKQHPLTGVGLGDIKDELANEYRKNNIQFGVDNNYNPHNQYLHTTVAVGVIGLFALLMLLISQFVLAFRNKNWMYALFILLISLNGMTESILERQAGILFFVFFSVFFYLQLKAKNNNLASTKSSK